MFFKNKQEVTDPTTKEKNQGMRLKNSQEYRRDIDPGMGIGICSD